MYRNGFVLIGMLLLTVVGAAPVLGQERPDSEVLLAAQHEAMGRFAVMDGEWRGEAWTMLPSGEKHHLTQTERVGPFLDGTVRVVEGRAYEKDGTLSFNAFAVISYDTQSETYQLRSYARGYRNDFEITPTADGFQWTVPAGPMTIRYTARIEGDTWHETGERIAPGEEPLRFFEMTLRRVGDSDWPAADMVGPE